MNVREATPVDVPHILSMLRQYRELTPFPYLKNVDDAQHIERLLANMMAGAGLVLVSETTHITGMFLAIISPSVWSPKHFLMNEVAYWVNPQDRGSTAGYRLIKAYVERGQALIAQGRISQFFVSKMVNSPDLDYGRFGFNKLEECWGS